MRQVLVALTVAVFIVPPLVAQESGVADELAEIEQRFARAWLEGDREWIEALLAPDWRVIDVTGRLRAKAVGNTRSAQKYEE